MNSILDYTEFRKDVTEVMDEVLKPLGFFILEGFSQDIYHPNTHLFYHRDNFLIEFNTLDTFPYSNDVSFAFVIKNNDGSRKHLDLKKVKQYLAINLDAHSAF